MSTVPQASSQRWCKRTLVLGVNEPLGCVYTELFVLTLGMPNVLDANVQSKRTLTFKAHRLFFFSAAAGDGSVEPVVLTDGGKRHDDASSVRILSQTIRESCETHAASEESASTGTRLGAYLHQASASAQSKHCDDGCNTALVEKNGSK